MRFDQCEGDPYVRFFINFSRDFLKQQNTPTNNDILKYFGCFYFGL